MCALFFIYVLACAALIFSTFRDGHPKCFNVAAKSLDKTVSEEKNDDDDDEVSQKEDESDVVDDEDKSDAENEESSVVEEKVKNDEEVFGSILANSDPFWCNVNPSRVLSYHKMVLAQKMRKNSLTSVYSKTVQELMMESMDKDGVDNKENGTPVAKRMIWKVKINNVGKNFCNRYKRCSDGIGIIIPQKQGGDGDGDDVDDLDFDKSFCGQSQKWKYFGLSLRDGKCHHSEKQKGGRKKRRNGNDIDNHDDDDSDDEYDSYDDYDDYDNYDNYDYGDYNDCEWDTEDDEDEYDGDNTHYGFKKGDKIVIDFDIERGILSFYRNDNIDGKVVRIKNFLQCVDINECRLAMDICDEQACYFLIDYQCEYDIERAANKASVDSENEANEGNKEKSDTFEEKKEMELGTMKKHLFGIMQELIDEAMSNMTNELKKHREVEVVTEDEPKVADVKDNKAGDEVNRGDDNDNDGDEMDAFDNDGDNKDLDRGNHVDEVDQVGKIDAVVEGVDHAQISDDEDEDEDEDDSMELDID